MRILKLSIGNAVLQQIHMPYIAVSAGLIHTTQFHLTRTVATVLKQGLGYGFYLKIRVFMNIMTSLCPPSKKTVHIALCMSFGILTVLKIFIVLQTREGGNVKIITDFVAAGVGDGGGVGGR